MENLIQKAFYSRLSKDRIKIRRNPNPVKMEDMISFLLVDLERGKNYLGQATGWTLLKNDKLGLEIKGGKVNGTEYLESIQYGKNLDNPYNNFVNPFYLFPIMRESGRKFFIDYYREEIDVILANAQSAVRIKEKELRVKKEALTAIKNEVDFLRSQNIN